MDSKIDMEEIREFFNPHPGVNGAVEPMPEVFKQVADDLNGKRISLKEVRLLLETIINKIDGGEIVIVASLIYLYYPHRPVSCVPVNCAGYMHHCWRLIEHRPVSTELS